jgi:glycerophosphoryl diester phosphodiesterase
VFGRCSPPQVIAHRGASAYAPEHSFAAFDLALAQGADVLELDVRLTADADLVLVHDATLLRTAGSPHAIARLTAADLAALDPAVRPPTLDEALDRYAGATRWLVDLKHPTPATEHAVATALTTRGLQHSAVVQSFDSGALRRIRRAAPSLTVSPLLRDPPTARRLRRLGTFAAAVGIRHTHVDMPLLLRARACGLAVLGWTANDTHDIARLGALGVDGVITDVPDRARAVVDGAALRDAA